VETTWAVINMVVSSAIVIGVAINWGRYNELNCMERTGHSAMAIFCAVIVMKSAYLLSLQEFRSDMFGILFRCSYLLCIIGNTYRNHKRTFDIWVREDRATVARKEVHC